MRSTGRGGRNVEALLSCAITPGDHLRIHALMVDTDGVDGLKEIDRVSAKPDTLACARGPGIKPRKQPDANDGHGFFRALGDALVTGPMRTNVNDFRATVVVA